MTQTLSRRRFLSLSAAAVALPAGAGASLPTAHWRGRALGAAASMTLTGINQEAAGNLFTAVESELARLERVFSLYREDSALTRLNKNGHLADPPAELLEVIALSDSLFHATGNAFDPTVQALWQVYASHAASEEPPSESEIQDALDQTGWRQLQFDSAEISFSREGMALTFNGIAQGYIADKVAELLRARGLTQVLIDMGEISAQGRRPDGRLWRAGIATPDGKILKRLPLKDRALATSAPRGTLLDPAGRRGHIIDPRNGLPTESWKLVSVSAESAALADGLSTAFCLLPRAGIAKTLLGYPDAVLEILV